MLLKSILSMYKKRCNFSSTLSKLNFISFTIKYLRRIARLVGSIYSTHIYSLVLKVIKRMYKYKHCIQTKEHMFTNLNK